MSELQKQLDDIDFRNSGEGIKVDNIDCSKHGEQKNLILYNEGGYNCTTICFKCFDEIKELVKNGI